MLKIALPNGSLEEGTMKLFEEVNLKIFKDPRKHEARIDSPLFSRVTFMRSQHIPKLVENVTYDVGICGWDCVCESESTIAMVAKLLYGRGTSDGQAKVVLVSSKENPVTKSSEIPKGSIILSKYLNITQKALGSSVDIRFSYGGTEAHIPNHYQYGVCLTDTGESLEKNGLKVIEVLLPTYTCFIANLSALNGEKADAIKTLQRLLVGRLEARDRVLLKMNISAEKKDAVLAILPALKKPTIGLLSDGISFAIESVVPKNNATHLMIETAKAGAQDVLELPINIVIQNW